MDSRKAPSSSSGRLPAFISRNKYFYLKKLKERALSLRGKLPAPYNSLKLLLRFWERESAPAESVLVLPVIYGH